MTDYISRQSAIEAVAKYEMDMAQIDDPEALQDIGSWEKVYEYVLKAIPTADVVEVVRCEDCKHRYYDKERNLYYCEMYFGLGIVKNNNYCSYGEREEA